MALACSESPFLIGLHMSDNGLRTDMELFLEILDMFGLNERCLEGMEDQRFVNNRLCQNPEYLRQVVRDHTGAISVEDL